MKGKFVSTEGRRNIQLRAQFHFHLGPGKSYFPFSHKYMVGNSPGGDGYSHTPKLRYKENLTLNPADSLKLFLDGTTE